MVSQDFPPPPPPRQIKDGKMAKWLVFGLRAASSLIWGDGPLLFDGGEGESGKFSHANIFFFIWMRLLLQTIFLCVSPFSCKHFNFSIAFFQCLQPPQTICFKLPHFCQKNNGPSLRTMHPLKLV